MLAPAVAASGARPSFEIQKLMDDPKQGAMTRVTFLKERSSVVISRYPQLGARKEDPQDSTPQFDVSRRVSARLNVGEMGTVLAVLDSRVSSAKLSSEAHDLTVSRDGDNGLKIAGTVSQGPRDQRITQDVELTFDKVRTAQLYHFLENSVTSSYSF